MSYHTLCVLCKTLFKFLLPLLEKKKIIKFILHSKDKTTKRHKNDIKSNLLSFFFHKQRLVGFLPQAQRSVVRTRHLENKELKL